MRSPYFRKKILIDALEPRTLLTVTPRIALLNNQAVITAGQAIHVNAVQAVNGTTTDLGAGSPLTARYQWDFGDTTSESRYNLLPGWSAGHVYDTPGLFTITLTITNENGEAGTAQQRVRIVPPSVTPQAIYVDNTLSGVQPDPTGGVDVPSIASAIPYLADNTQLLFHRGQTFSLINTISVPFGNVTIGAYGDGDSPTLLLPSGSGTFQPFIQPTSSARNTVIRDIKFVAAGSSRIGVAIQPFGQALVVRNCEFQNLDDAILSNFSPVGVLAMDNKAGVLKEYFAYIKGTDHVYLGNTVDDSTGQHNFRTYGIRVLCYGNDLTNLPISASLHTLRINDGAWMYWANNTLHGGPISVGPLGPDSAGALPGSGISWVCIENNRWYQVPGNWSNHNRIDVDAGVQHIVIRNNYVEATDANGIAIDTKDVITWPSSTLPGSPIPLPPVTVTRTSTDVMVLNNTIVNPNLNDGTHLGTKGSFIEVSGSTSNSVTLRNNLYIAPRLDTTAFTAAAVRVTSRNDLNNFVSGGISNNDWPAPSNLNSRGVHYVSDGSLTGTAAYYTPSEWSSTFPSRVSGEKYENLQVSDLDANLFPPSSSLAATGAVKTVGVFTDLYGNVRTGTVWTNGGVQLDTLSRADSVAATRSCRHPQTASARTHAQQRPSKGKLTRARTHRRWGSARWVYAAPSTALSPAANRSTLSLRCAPAPARSR